MTIEKKRSIPILFALVFAGLVVYLPALNGGFIWDDEQFIHEQTPDLEGLKNIWTPGKTRQYYPLTFTTFWLEQKIAGQEPFVYHIDNVCLHILNSVLLYFLLLRLKIPGAWFAVFLFLLHPVHVESVAWISERKNVLSGCFYLLSLIAYSKYRFPDEATSVPRSRSFYGTAFLLFCFALMSKTVTCTLPAAILLLIWWRTGSLKSKDVIILLPFFILGILSGLMTAHFEKIYTGAQGTEWHLSVTERMLIAGRAIWFYLGKLLLPMQLTFSYPRWTIQAQDLFAYLYPLGVVIVLAGLWFLRNRLGRGPVTAVLFFIGTLFPALGFIDTFPMRFSFVADHFQYLASLGPMVLFASISTGALERYSSGAMRQIVLLGVQGCLLCVFGILSWQQAGIYKSHETVWKDTIHKNPMSWMAHNNLSQELRNQGKLDKAIQHVRQALQLKPDYYTAHDNLGVLLIEKENYSGAERAFEQALQLRPHSSKAHVNLGVALAKQDKAHEAIKHYQMALEIDPDVSNTHKNLAGLMTEAGEFEEASAHYLEALRLDPDDAETVRSLGKLRHKQGRFDEAVRYFREAIRLDPDYAEAYNSLSVTLARVGRRREAMDVLARAIEINPNYESAHKNYRILSSQEENP